MHTPPGRLFSFVSTVISFIILAAPAHALEYKDEFIAECVSNKNLKTQFETSPLVFAATIFREKNDVSLLQIKRIWKGTLDAESIIAYADPLELKMPYEKYRGRMYIVFAKKISDKHSRRDPFPLLGNATCRPPMSITRFKQRDPDPEDVFLGLMDQYAK